MPRDCETPEEIEITPEMVAAGVRAYFSRDSRFESEDEIVTNIFIAMTRAAASSPVGHWRAGAAESAADG